jgi:hypothetical protein
MTDERGMLSDAIAESVAASLCEFNHKLLYTGLDPDQILECVLRVCASKLRDFRDAPEAAIQDFTDRLGVAICDRMLMERDLEILRRTGMRPQ